MRNLEEKWKDIPGFEGYYEVSNYGRVRSWKGINQYSGKRKSPSIMKLRNRRGYMCVDILHQKKHHYFSVHRIVANVFVPNPKNKPEVNHIDGNKTNNSFKNFEWVTSSENQQHSFGLGLQDCSGENNGRAKLTNKNVIRIKRLLKKGRLTHKQIAKPMGVSPATISDIKTGKSWRHI